MDSGESYPDAAVRELEEELNMRAPLRQAFKVTACEQTDREHSMLYVAELKRGDPKPNPNPEEILEGRFFRKQELAEALECNPDSFTSSFRHLYLLYIQSKNESQV